MSNFKSMFPNVDAVIIEQILRKHKGDVTNTINEILNISAANDSGFNNASTSSNGLPTKNQSFNQKDTQGKKSLQNNNQARLVLF